MKAVMYVDGSALKVKNTNHYGIGVVLLHNDQMHELSYYLSGNGGISYHEYFAMAEGVKLTQRLGLVPKDVSVYCDDELMGYAPFNLHAGNYSPKSVVTQEILNKLQVDGLHEFLMGAKVTKLKGHRQEVYQERVDYLAKYALRTGMGEYSDFVEYDDWLVKGFKHYDPTIKEVTTFYPPFTNSL